jgi:hypothetical protein
VCTLSGSELSGLSTDESTKSEVKMIDPASAADWTRASLVAGLLGGLAAACRWALHQEQHEPIGVTALNEDALEVAARRG